MLPSLLLGTERPSQQQQRWRVLVTAQLGSSTRWHWETSTQACSAGKGEYIAESSVGGQCHYAAKIIETVIKRLFHKSISCCMSQLANCHMGFHLSTIIKCVCR